MTTRAPNLHPRTSADDPRCLATAINERDLVLHEEGNGKAWLAAQDAPELREWR